MLQGKQRTNSNTQSGSGNFVASRAAFTVLGNCLAMSSPGENPLVYTTFGAGQRMQNYFSMRKLSEVSDRELVQALNDQGTIIGNLEHEKTRMMAQYHLLDGELSRRILAGTF